MKTGGRLRRTMLQLNYRRRSRTSARPTFESYRPSQLAHRPEEKQWHSSQAHVVGIVLDRDGFKYFNPETKSYTGEDPLRLASHRDLSGQRHNRLVNLDPKLLHFSQRTVNSDGRLIDGDPAYTAAMKAGRWDWTRSGPVRVIKVHGSYVSYNNRRVLAAQDAGLDSIPVEIVKRRQGSVKPGKTWKRAFRDRLRDPRNVAAGGAIPATGLAEQPTVVVRQPH